MGKPTYLSTKICFTAPNLEHSSWTSSLISKSKSGSVWKIKRKNFSSVRSVRCRCVTDSIKHHWNKHTNAKEDKFWISQTKNHHARGMPKIHEQTHVQKRNTSNAGSNMFLSNKNSVGVDMITFWVVTGSTGAPGTDPTAATVGDRREAAPGAPITEVAGKATPAAPIPPVKL